MPCVRLGSDLNECWEVALHGEDEWSGGQMSISRLKLACSSNDSARALFLSPAGSDWLPDEAVLAKSG